jgi:hypothetical protein
LAAALPHPDTGDITRYLGLVVDTSLTGLRVARELDRIAELRLSLHDRQRQWTG